MNSLDTYVVYLDDAHYARTQLASTLALPHVKRFILVACAPQMTRRIGKWLSHSARKNWRDKWCEKLFAQFTPYIHHRDHVFCEVATGSPPAFTQDLLKSLPGAKLLDARRPKLGVSLAPLTEPPVATPSADRAVNTPPVLGHPAVRPA